VLRSGITDRESAVAARTRLAEDGIRIFGIILNDWTPQKNPRYGQYSSYYASRAAH
jgi:Mrp family chromosome partitioning ATPase